MPYAVKFYAYIFMANVLAFVIVARWLLSYSRSLGGVAAAQSNISLGTGALASNTTGANNTANGLNALVSNTTGGNNTRFRRHCAL